MRLAFPLRLELGMNAAHRCEGNMVISLDDQNPSQLLLSCIREAGLSNPKDDAGFVLGVFENGEVTFFSISLSSDNGNSDAT